MMLTKILIGRENLAPFRTVKKGNRRLIFLPFSKHSKAVFNDRDHSNIPEQAAY